MFHSPDTSLKRLNACLKRAARFAKSGRVDKSHKLYVPFSNMQWYLDGEEISPSDLPGYWDSLTSYEKTLFLNFHEREQIVQNLVALDWFAMKVDDYSKDNMIEGDETLGAMLFEWRKKMPFNLARKKAQ